MSGPLLQMNGLKVQGWADEAWQDIVHGVDLEVGRGEILGLIGESGAGKSTIGAAAMGVAREGTRIAGGRVTFDGVDLTTARASTLRDLRGRRIAYVAQSAAASFNPAHRIIDQHTEAPVMHGLSGREAAQRDAVALYEKLRLPEPEQIGFRYPHQVSGGQLQRAMTAMAMACRPDLIIFDEPTTALDVTTQIGVLAAIREVVAELGTSAIYISHDLAVVAQMADRITVLRDGCVVESAPVREMLSAPKADYTKSLWAVRSLERSEAPALPAGAPVRLDVSGVSAAYRSGPRVVEDVGFDLWPGRTIAVVGESGSGKSTLARCITGLLPPEAGQIALNGNALPADYRDRSTDQLRRIQMIYQSADTALNPNLRISEIIGRPARFYRGLKGRDLRTRVDELLEMIELPPDRFRNRYPTELSGGQKQRIGIARALAADPEVVICDEVTSALDQIVAEGILKLLDRLQRELDLSYIVITHDLATVRAVADDVMVMQNGAVVEQGAKTEVFTPPHHPYTEELLASVPQMDPDWLTDRLQGGASGLPRAATP